LLHLDDAAAHGPSFCFAEACTDWLKQHRESGASAPESLFIVTRGHVNKKQRVCRRKVEKKCRAIAIR
jgi:hypothetical protein